MRSCAVGAASLPTAATPLHSTRAARTARVRNGKAVVIDGPFAETKEQLLGFMLVEARDLDEAVSLASNDRMAAVGSIEVRPIMDLVAA